MPTPVLPTPRTWSPGQLIKAPYLRADVTDAVALLQQPPLFTGSQTLSAQSISNSANIRVSIDTETYDNYGGHQDNVTSPQNYYGMFPGWYLCEFSAPLNYTGGAGIASAMIGLSTGGGALATYGGQRIPNSGTSGQFAQPAVAKLCLMTNVGTYAGAINDFACPSFNQSSGASQGLLLTAARFPYFKALWVAAASGTAGLIVPTNDTWPVPPGYTTSAFLNKNIRDTIRFLIYPPIMEAQYNPGTATLASQSVIPSVGTALPLGTTNADNYGAFSTGTSTWTAPAAGTYYAYGQSALLVSATSLALAAGLTVTSANYSSGAQVTLWGGTQAAQAVTGAINCAIVRRKLRLNAGDTVQLAGFQHDSSSNTATIQGNATNWTSRLIMVWRNA